jgi:hypothetical protein
LPTPAKSSLVASLLAILPDASAVRCISTFSKVQTKSLPYGTIETRSWGTCTVSNRGYRGWRRNRGDGRTWRLRPVKTACQTQHARRGTCQLLHFSNKLDPALPCTSKESTDFLLVVDSFLLRRKEFLEAKSMPADIFCQNIPRN